MKYVPKNDEIKIFNRMILDMISFCDKDDYSDLINCNSGRIVEAFRLFEIGYSIVHTTESAVFVSFEKYGISFVLKFDKYDNSISGEYMFDGTVSAAQVTTEVVVRYE